MQTSGSEQEIFTRADATLAVANTLLSGGSAYQWDEMDNVTFGGKISAARAARQLADDLKADYDAQRGLTNARFDDLERLKVQGLGMAKYRFRADARLLEMVNSVGEYGGAREDTLKEAAEWSAAWNNIAPTWGPTSHNTLANFNAISADCLTQMNTLTGLKSNARKTAIDLNALLAELEDLSITWYGVATRVFPVGTTEGDLIRSQIPTFESGNVAVTPTPVPVPPTG